MDFCKRLTKFIIFFSWVTTAFHVFWFLLVTDWQNNFYPCIKQNNFISFFLNSYMNFRMFSCDCLMILAIFSLDKIHNFLTAYNWWILQFFSASNLGLWITKLWILKFENQSGMTDWLSNFAVSSSNSLAKFTIFFSCSVKTSCNLPIPPTSPALQGKISKC